MGRHNVGLERGFEDYLSQELSDHPDANTVVAEAQLFLKLLAIELMLSLKLAQLSLKLLAIELIDS